MNIYPLIYFPIILYAFKNYHRAFLLYAVTTPTLSTMVPFMVGGSGLPTILMQPFMNAFMFMCFILNNKKRENISANTAFPFKRAFLICIISVIVSTILSSSIAPLHKSLSLASQHIFNTYVFAYLLWKELKSRWDIQFFIKGIMIVFCVAVAYGFFERFNDFYNPLFEYQSSINPEAEMFGYGDESRAGLGRVHSIFANALDCSAYMGVVLVFFYYMSMRHRKIWNSPAVMKISFMAGMAFILLFSNSRGGMLYVGLSLLFILKLKNMLRLALFLPFLVLLFYDWLAPYAVTVLSIFNSDRADEAGGSSLAMRVLQFLATIEVWKDRALFGYGPFAVRYLQELRPDLPFFGFESIWLQLLIREGILGVIAHIYLLYSMMKLGVNKSKRYVVGSVIACIALTSATVGLSLSFFMSLLLVVYRLELLSDTQHTIKEMQP